MSTDPTPPPEPEVLSLDDAEPLPPKAAPKRFRWWYIPLSLLLTAMAVLGVYLGFVALRGDPEGINWADFRPPGGDAVIHMPVGALEAEPDLGGRPMVESAKLFRLNRLIWMRRLTCEFGWYDLGVGSPGEADLIRLAERDREELRGRIGGRVVREGVVRLGEHVGREIVLQTDDEHWASRLILDANRNRVYRMTLGGTALEEGSPVIGKFFNSLRIEPKE